MNLSIDRDWYTFPESNDKGSHEVGTAILIKDGNIFELHSICHFNEEIDQVCIVVID